MDGYQDKDTPWRDEEKLRELYIERNLSQKEVGEKLGCSGYCISRWLRKHGIDEEAKPKYQDKEWLKQKYVKEGLSTIQIGNLLDVESSTIWSWLDKHDIDVPKPCDRPANFRHSSEPNPAYEYWECGTTGKIVYVHRLLAVAKYGFDAVENMDVHHDNEIPWDNRSCNIQPIDPSEHLEHHWHDSEYDYRKRTVTPHTQE